MTLRSRTLYLVSLICLVSEESLPLPDKVKLDSEVGRGSVFTVILPLQAAEGG